MARRPRRFREQIVSVMILKAACAVLLVWLLLPRQPELATAGPLHSESFYSVESIRLKILDAVVRVRADLKANRHSM
jgi:hypothetical protein